MFLGPGQKTAMESGGQGGLQGVQSYPWPVGKIRIRPYAHTHLTAACV